MLPLIFLSFLCGSLALLSTLNAAGPKCSDYIRTMVSRPNAQPVEVKVGPRQILFHNRELASLVTSLGMGPELLRQSYKLLQDQKTFEIPVLETGVMVAASRGSYSKKAWHRDHARGVRAYIQLGDTEKARKMAMASIRQMATPNQLARIRRALVNPAISQTEGDGALPHVIFDPQTLEDASVPWSAQKDAWGLYLHTVLDAFEAGIVKIGDLTNDEREAFFGLAALMVRLEFWRFTTTDSWEEEHAVYTSGVGIVTAALERIVDEIMKADGTSKFAEYIARSNVLIRESLSAPALLGAVDNGYRVIREQLRSGGEAPFLRKPHGRGADTALLWLFFYRLKQLTEEDYRLVLKIVRTLVRDVGMLRYESPYLDGYLNPAYFFARDEVVPGELLRVNESTTGGKVTQAFYDRNIGHLVHLFGRDFSAQWSLGLIVSAQAHAHMLEWFPKSEHLQEYKDGASEFLLRMLGTVSPSGELAVALDGLDVPPFKFGEAITRVRLYHEFSDVKGSYSVYSPFTQLNWATAEALIAYIMLWKLFIKEEFPR